MVLLPKFVLAIRVKSSKVPGKLNITSMPQDDSNLVWNMPQNFSNISCHPSYYRFSLLVLDSRRMTGLTLASMSGNGLSREAPECIQDSFWGSYTLFSVNLDNMRHDDSYPMGNMPQLVRTAPMSTTVSCYYWVSFTVIYAFEMIYVCSFTYHEPVGIQVHHHVVYEDNGIV
ncbi:hypothetical protein J1N35_028547 [Gossypium stocksii]|uniref:Uncharacterized protein n=1 Tax=Gossypium stocksii TaxID=47602 RepID=A0A9D3UWK2_9ROSI|nr:hypothetical protein J1N35_028547 [Gossypium stocksii]